MKGTLKATVLYALPRNQSGAQGDSQQVSYTMKELPFPDQNKTFIKNEGATEKHTLPRLTSQKPDPEFSNRGSPQKGARNTKYPACEIPAKIFGRTSLKKAGLSINARPHFPISNRPHTGWLLIFVISLSERKPIRAPRHNRGRGYIQKKGVSQLRYSFSHLGDKYGAEGETRTPMKEPSLDPESDC